MADERRLADERPLLEPELAERARRCARGELPAVAVRAAATVVLLRDAPGGPEAFLLRRPDTMAFAPGMHVFPGGAVDPRDADPGLAWAGPPPAEVAGRLGCDPATAQASVCAAVRETYEESGVLLAGPDADHVVQAVAGEAWAADRAALLDGSLALRDLLDRRGLVLRADLVAAWAHWVTPRYERRRYDTHFFVAAVPPAQRAQHLSGETASAAWARPADALADGLAMLPPTSETLRSLLAYAEVGEVLAAAAGRTIRRQVPGWLDDGEGVRLLLPADPDWPGDDPGDAP